MPALTKQHGVTGVVLPAGPTASKQPGEANWGFEIALRWTTVRMRGAGYYNLGNTCFMNSVIQALVHTPPFAELILGDRGKQLLEELLVLSRHGQEDDSCRAGSRGGDDDNGGAADDGGGGDEEEEGSDGDVVLIVDDGRRGGCRSRDIIRGHDDDDKDDDEVVLIRDDDDVGGGGDGGSGGGDDRGGCRRGRTEVKPAVVLALELMRAAFSATALSPDDFVKSLPQLNKQFRRGRQEDSHEFLRCLLDALHEACLKRFGPKPPPELVESTFVFRIFGGKLRHQITRPQQRTGREDGVTDGSSSGSSSNTSSTYEPFLDLSLGIREAQSVEEAMGDLTAAAALEGDNMYRCAVDDGEEALVRAERRTSVEDPPVVLTLHLMRFDVDEDGDLIKVASAVGFGAWLDLRPYMSDTSGAPVMYELYAVLVHIGRSAIRGHYVCYTKAGDGRWYLCNDSIVTQVEEHDVLGKQAYILFYIRRPPGDADAAAAAATAAAAAAATEQRTRSTPPLRVVAKEKDGTAVTAKAGIGAGQGRDRAQVPGSTSPPTYAPPAPVVGARAPAAAPKAAALTRSPAAAPAPVRRAPAAAAALPRQREEDASVGGVLVPADRAKRQRQAAAASGAAAPAPSGLAVKTGGAAAALRSAAAAAAAGGSRAPNTINALALMLANVAESRQLQAPKLKGSHTAAATARRQRDAQVQPVQPQQAPQPPPPQLQPPPPPPQGAHEPRRRQAHGGAAAHHEGPAADGRACCIQQRVLEPAKPSGHAASGHGATTGGTGTASPPAAVAAAAALASAQQASSGGSRALGPGGKPVRAARPRGRCGEMGLPPPQRQSPQSERSGASVEAVVGLLPPQQPPQQPQQQEQQRTQPGDRGPPGRRGQQREAAAAEVLPERKRGRFAAMLSSCLSEAL